MINLCIFGTRNSLRHGCIFDTFLYSVLTAQYALVFADVFSLRKRSDISFDPKINGGKATADVFLMLTGLSWIVPVLVTTL